jgi:hypothetical protein
LLLVKDRSLVEGLHVVPDQVTILEWGIGSLDNAGEPLQLSKPGVADGDGRHPWIAVDRIVYSDGSHGAELPGGVDGWPVAADGSGLSLTRIVPEDYGNVADNWQATDASPGTARYRPRR